MSTEFILNIALVFFLIYLLAYAACLFISVAVGAYRLYRQDRMHRVHNELKHEYYFPVSILVPAFNEESTILSTVNSLLRLNYRLYEIIVVDDGSCDNTAQVVIDHFHLQKVDRPIRRSLSCRPQESVYESDDNRVKLTLIRKENGGKGDALNMGINAAQFPFFLCVDADSVLQRDSLERIVQPVMEDDRVVAVGGLIRVGQCVRLNDGLAENFRLPRNPILCMQVMEYDRAFLASRILLDTFNGNLITSGAFALFRKDVVIAAGGYDTGMQGEDMELILRMHIFCRTNQIPYSIRYEPNAVCWSQAPSTLSGLGKQRRRWYLGLFHSLLKHKGAFLSPRLGGTGSVSYLYHLLYEVFSPQLLILGAIVFAAAGWTGLLSFPFMLRLFLLFALYSSILTITAFFQRLYTQNLKLSTPDVFKAFLMCLAENIFFRFLLDLIRAASLPGRKKPGRR